MHVRGTLLLFFFICAVLTVTCSSNTFHYQENSCEKLGFIWYVDLFIYSCEQGDGRCVTWILLSNQSHTWITKGGWFEKSIICSIILPACLCILVKLQSIVQKIKSAVRSQVNTNKTIILKRILKHKLEERSFPKLNYVTFKVIKYILYNNWLQEFNIFQMMKFKLDHIQVSL